MQKQYQDSVPLALDGSYLQAAAVIEDARDSRYREKDRVLYYLDLGMLYHWAGEYELSNQALDEAERGIEELFTRSVSKAMASGVLNDNALDYAGEDYEDIYLNIFKALNYIALGRNDSALVEIRRVQIKLNLLEDKYRDLVDRYNSDSESEGKLEYRDIRFHNNALARYLGLLLYRSEGSVDDARIDRDLLEDAWRSQSQLYPFTTVVPPRIDLPENRAVVNVLSFSGLGPVKKADTLYLHSGPDIMYVAISGQSDDYVQNLLGFTFLVIPGLKAGIHFKIQFPRFAARGSEVDNVVLRIDGEDYGTLNMLENLDLIAEEAYRVRQPLTVGKTIIRATAKAVGKEIGKQAMQDSLESQGAGAAIFGLLAGLAADVAVDATENADLRISHFFPSDIRALEVEVETGPHHVEVEYRRGGKTLAVEDHGIVDFAPAELNLIESYVLR